MPYDAFYVSLVENLSYDWNAEDKAYIMCFWQRKTSEAMLDWRQFCTDRNFLHMVGTSVHHRKSHLFSDHGFLRIRIIFVGVSDLVSELPMNNRSFELLPTEGSQETISGQTGLAQSSSPEHSKWEMNSWITIWRVFSLKARVWVHKSDSKRFKHNFNTCILFTCFDQICK